MLFEKNKDLLIYYYFHNPLARYTLDVIEIIIAVTLLTYLEQFGNQFGGRENLSTKHEIVSIDSAFHTSDSILQSNDSYLQSNSSYLHSNDSMT